MRARLGPSVAMFERGGKRGRGGRSGHNGRSGYESAPPAPRPPPHLRGRAIGLFYRDRHRLNKKRPAMLEIPVSLKDNLYDVLHSLEEDRFKKDDDNTGKCSFLNEYLDIINVSFMEKLTQAIALAKPSRCSQEVNERLYEEHLTKQKHPRYCEMLAFRRKLPAYDKRTEILRKIHENQVIVVSGETGCGKTTQVGQLILEEACVLRKGGDINVLITQPRRIAAVSVANRIADERGERLGLSVGYTIRLDSKTPRHSGSIELVTSGVLMQRLQSDPALFRISHLIIDEVHERDSICDILMGIVKMVITKRKDLKIILMSASIESDRFCQYFGECPLIHIPGIMFPVKELYIEDALELTGFINFDNPKFSIPVRNRRRNSVQFIADERKKSDYAKMISPYISFLRGTGLYSDRVLELMRNSITEDLNLQLVASLVKALTRAPEGAILVFLPGYADISKVCKFLNEMDLPPHSLFPLHSRLNTSDQQLIFQRPPYGVRKIVIATNIAETSITIDDVVYVVDCGKMKITDFVVDQNLSTLTSQWISAANAQQRKGRAGRVQAGECWRLYSKARFLEFDPRPAPELLRTPLHEPILSILLLRLGPASVFMSKLLDCPQPDAVKNAIDLLCRMRILDDSLRLTPLGVHVARLPVAPGAARMLILAALMSAIAPTSAIAATIAFKDPFVLPMGKEKEAETRRLDLSMGLGSDQIAAAEAQRRWENLSHNDARYFCHRNFLNYRTMEMLQEMRGQFGSLLHSAKFLSSPNPDDPKSNVNSKNDSLIKALIVAGLYPNVATYKGMTVLKTDEDKHVELHPGSVNRHAKPLANRLVFRLKQRSTSTFLHDTSPAHALPLLFFGDHYTITACAESEDLVLVEVGGGRWTMAADTADLLKHLREALDELLQSKLENPGPVNWESSEGALLNAIIHLITAEDGCNHNENESEDCN